MTIYPSNPDRPRRPRPWTAPHPPRPYSTKLLDQPTVIAFAVMFGGVALLIVSRSPAWLLVAAAGATYFFCHAVVDVARWFQVRRWMNSPPTTTTLDDAL